MFVFEVIVVDLEKPVVLSFLLIIPMAYLPARLHYLPSPDFLLNPFSFEFFRPLLLDLEVERWFLVLEGGLDFVFLLRLYQTLVVRVEHSVRQLHKL